MLAPAATLIPEAFGIDPAGSLAKLLRDTRPDLIPEVGTDRASASAVAVRIEGLEKRFGENPVLRGVDLVVPAGQFVAIVGQSGCGKSTLLRLLVELEEPSAGRIAFENEGGAGSGRRIMFQEPRLLPWARVVDNVAVGLGRNGSRRERQALALDALARVGLADKAQAWPATLSGGQRQRVALARALVSRPGFLALDEPLGALDALTRLDMQSLIEGVWRTAGFTAVLVTHDVGEAVALADRILVIDEGRIALDLPVPTTRPRRRGDAALAALEGRILDHLFRDRRPADPAAAKTA